MGILGNSKWGVQTREFIKPKPDTAQAFTVVYADPPWRYEFSKSNSREIENQYPTMSLAACGLSKQISSVVMGMGYWFRGQHEILLVGTRGKVSPPAQSLRVSSVIKEKRSRHSKKPDKVRDMIASWFPTENKIELFARQTTVGWAAWGNEVNNVTPTQVASQIPTEIAPQTTAEAEHTQWA